MYVFTLLISAISLTVSSELIDQASFIANSSFQHRTSTSVIWWKSDPSIVTDFLNSYQGSVQIIKIKNYTNISEFNEEFGYKQVVFFAIDPEEFEYFVTNLNETIIYPIRVILVITLPVNEHDTLEEYMNICKDNDISDIVVVSKRSDECNITLSTYMPYGPNGCGNSIPIKLDLGSKKFFPQKFNNFHGCPINVILANTFPYVIPNNNDTEDIRGLDTDIIDIVFKELNASTYKLFSKNSGAHVFEHVVEGRYDISLPSIILSSYRYRSSQASHVFKTLDIVICAPNQREIYAWAKVLLPFFTITTPLIILSFLLFLGSVALIQRFGKLRRNIPEGIVFGTLGLFLGQEVKFETKYWLNNGVFLLWIWYCTLVRITYQGELVQGLQRTFLEPHLKSVAEALSVVDEYGGPEGLMLRFKQSHQGKKSNIIPWVDIPHYIEEISEGKRYLLVTDISLIRHSSLKVQIVDERLSSLPMAFFMRPRWGAAREIDRWMVQLFETGFMAKIKNDYKPKAVRTTSPGAIDPLTLNTVASCFFGLVILGFLWTIVLFIEIVWNKVVQSRLSL